MITKIRHVDSEEIIVYLRGGVRYGIIHAFNVWLVHRYENKNSIGILIDICTDSATAINIIREITNDSADRTS